jgi:hypothetical protein
MIIKIAVLWGALYLAFSKVLRRLRSSRVLLSTGFLTICRAFNGSYRLSELYLFVVGEWETKKLSLDDYLFDCLIRG